MKTTTDRGKLPTAAEADDMCGRAFAEAARELREEHEREKFRRLVEDFEWLEEHAWILPPEKRWTTQVANRAKIVGLIKARAWDLAARRVPPGNA